ncbi:MAG: hypothetical protein HOJ11_08300 [Gammaproteobacteria bacterium]|jgi:hypothetical protein|nr:hypothetical protein [Gammaproteobacteria bacterium]
MAVVTALKANYCDTESAFDEHSDDEAYCPLLAKVNGFGSIISIDAKGEVRDKATRDPFDHRQYHY